MKAIVRVIVILMCLANLTTARKIKRKDYPHHYEVVQYQNEGYGPEENIQYGYHQVNPSSKAGYSNGSGLRSIAQGSADQATSAVANQHVAAKQASYVAQNTLAQAAVQAATTALAALKGKEVLLQRLEQQNREAQHSLEEELAQLQQAKRSAKAAHQSAQQASNHVSVLTAALNNAQNAAEHAQQSAAEAAAELASQTSMVGQAKQRLEHLENQLNSARVDYEATREAADKASSSAQEAQNNANEAAIHASVGLHESAIAKAASSHDDSEEIALNHNYGDSVNDHTYNLSGY